MIYVPTSTPRSRARSRPAHGQRPVADQFYGDRTGTLADPFGHVWSLATHVEDVAGGNGPPLPGTDEAAAGA